MTPDQKQQIVVDFTYFLINGIFGVVVIAICLMLIVLVCYGWYLLYKWANKGS